MAADPTTTKATHNRRVKVSLEDALEILSANLGMLVTAGARVEHSCTGGVLSIRVYGVEEMRDSEGAYFVPARTATP
jgi:hypothetical protein